MRPLSHGVPLLVLAAAISENANAVVTQANPDFAAVRLNPAGGTVSVTIDVVRNDESTSGGLFVADFQRTTAEYGTVTIDNDGNLIYTANGEFTGEDTFTYNPGDQDEPYGGDITGLVTISILPASSDEEEEGPIETITVGESAKETAGMLDEVCLGDNQMEMTPEINEACSSLLSLVSGPNADPAAANQIVTEITPEEVLMQRRMMSEQTRGQTSRVYSTQSMIRSGINPSFLVLNNQVVPLHNYNGGAASDDQASPWALFGSVHIDQVEHDRSSYEAGYESSAYGITAGVDYRLNEAMHVGAALDWTTYDVDYDINAGNLESDFYNLTGYFSWFFDDFTWDVQLGYAIGDIAIERNMTFPTTSTISADTDSDQINLSTQIDWTYSTGPWTGRPFLRLDYLTTSVDGYAEEGTNPWLMEVGDQDLEQLTTSVGGEVTYAWSLDWGVLLPSFKLSAVSESASDYAPVSFKLLGDSGTSSQFSLQPESEDEMFFQYDLGAVFVMKNGVSSFLTVQFISGYENLSAYHLSGGINIEL